MSAYWIDGRRLAPDDEDFAAALATAHASRTRPRCLCGPSKPEMYVAHLGATFRVKRMPGSGSRHAPTCSSYEPTSLPSSAGHENAIVTRPDTGETLLKLDFALSRAQPGYGDTRTDDDSHGRPAGRGLTLEGLLRYLWDEAGLTQWQASFAGRRSWATVYRRLTRAARGKIASRKRLEHVLYIPEPFYAHGSTEIAARRKARWAAVIAPARGARSLLLLIAELKELASTRLGAIAVVKQVPEKSFTMSDDLYRRATKHFQHLLLLWDNSASVHMMIVATFAVSGTGGPTIEDLALMPTNAQWLPLGTAGVL
jgi:hypothetical protein